MSSASHQLFPCYTDLCLTLPPVQARQAMLDIDQLPRSDRNYVLQQFDRCKEQSHIPLCQRLRARLRSRCPCLVRHRYKLLDDLIERYHRARRQYDGGYYLRYLPDPEPYQSFQAYYQQHRQLLQPLVRFMVDLQTGRYDGITDPIHSLQAINNKIQQDNE